MMNADATAYGYAGPYILQRWPTSAHAAACAWAEKLQGSGLANMQGGAAQHVATALDARLREHLKSRSNLFTESSSGLTIARPLLCLFDRNFELSVVSCLADLVTFTSLVARLASHLGVLLTAAAVSVFFVAAKRVDALDACFMVSLWCVCGTLSPASRSACSTNMNDLICATRFRACVHKHYISLYITLYCIHHCIADVACLYAYIILYYIHHIALYLVLYT